MANIRYGKPPITEAIIDLRVEPRPGVSAVEIADGFRDLTEEFPYCQELPVEGNPLQTYAGHAGSSYWNPRSILAGFRYESADRRRIFQARRDGCVYSLIGTPEQQYEGWEVFSREARRLWERYRDAWRPKQVVRIALRYVNQFDFPGPETPHLEEYFALFLSSPREGFLPTLQLGGYSFQVVLPQTDLSAMAVINQVMLQTPPQTGLSILLDIDLFRDGILWNPTEDEQIWEMLNSLRTRKNRVFQACLTEKAESRLEPVVDPS